MSNYKKFNLPTPEVVKLTKCIQEEKTQELLCAEDLVVSIVAALEKGSTECTKEYTYVDFAELDFATIEKEVNKFIKPSGWKGELKFSFFGTSSKFYIKVKPTLGYRIEWGFRILMAKAFGK
jgi:hypothetical protein